MPPSQCSSAEFCLCETDPDGLGTFTALGDVDHYALAFVERVDPGPIEHRGMHKGILAAIIADNEAKALLGVEPLHRSGLLDGRLRRNRSPARRRVGRTPGSGRRRRAAVDAQDFGDLRSFLSRRHTDLQRLPSLHRANAVPVEYAGMEERVPRSIRQLDKTKASFRLEPLDHRAHGGTGWGFEPRWGVARRCTKFTEMRVVTVVVKIAAPALAKIPVSDQLSIPVESVHGPFGTAGVDCSKKSTRARAD